MKPKTPDQGALALINDQPRARYERYKQAGGKMSFRKWLRKERGDA